MSVQELAERCMEAWSNGRDVQLVIPREARGRRITLAGRGTPMSRDIAHNIPGETLAWFDPMEILAYLRAEGVLDIRTQDGESI